MDRMIPNFTSLPDALTQTAATANGRSRQRDEGDARAEVQPAQPAPAQLSAS
jgi:hypothetical protein